MQTLAVAVLAAGLGWRLGVATVALYLIEGLSGLPVFANGGGFAYVFSPSFSSAGSPTVGPRAMSRCSLP